MYADQQASPKVRSEPLLELRQSYPMRVAIEDVERQARNRLGWAMLIGGGALVLGFTLHLAWFQTGGVVVALISAAFGWSQVHQVLKIREDRRFGTYIQAAAVGWKKVERPGQNPNYYMELVSVGSVEVVKEVYDPFKYFPLAVVAIAWSSHVIFEIRSPSGVLLYRSPDYERALRITEST